MDIKDLENKIIDGTITLSSALLYVKQILETVGDDKDLTWINKEIYGYEERDELPLYRQIKAPVKFRCDAPFIKSQIVSLESLEFNDDPNVGDSFKKVNQILYKEPLVAIETTWNAIDGTYGESGISDKQLELLEQWFKDQLVPVAGHITRGWHEIPKSEIANLFNEIKIKLLSIINYLYCNYPSLNNKSMNDSTNHVVISGNNNPVNIINGHYNVITSTNTLSDEIVLKLKQLGATENEIDNLRGIMKSEPSKSHSLKDKVNEWLKGLSAAADVLSISQILSPLLSL